MLAGLSFLFLSGQVDQDIQAIGKFVLAHREDLLPSQIGCLLTDPLLFQEQSRLRQFLVQQIPGFKQTLFDQLSRRDKHSLHSHNKSSSDHSPNTQQVMQPVVAQQNLIQCLRSFFNWFEVENDPHRFDALISPFSQMFYKLFPQNFASREAVHLLSFASLMIDIELHAHPSQKIINCYFFNHNRQALAGIDNNRTREY